MKNKERNKIKRAQRRVVQLKSFYSHVIVFIVINGSLFLLKNKMTSAIFGEEALGNPKLMSWIDWNAYVWAVILAIHAIIVFSRIQFFVKKWEEHQVEKIMQKEKGTEVRIGNIENRITDL